jgi:hypothetical protein
MRAATSSTIEEDDKENSNYYENSEPEMEKEVYVHFSNLEGSQGAPGKGKRHFGSKGRLERKMFDI